MEIRFRRTEALSIGDFEIINAGVEPAARWLLGKIMRRERLALFFANTNFVTKCRHLAKRMSDESVVILNDGVGLDLAAWIIHRHTFDENLNGTDFIPYLLQRSPDALRVFLLGAQPEVVPKATAFVERVLGHQVVGACDGYSAREHDDQIAHYVNESRPDVLLVALGNPLQEEWILAHFDKLDVPLVMGVGGLFDFWSGTKPRAPLALRRCRLEWLFRLCMEPRRLFARYTVEIVQFMLYCLRHKP